MVHCDTCGSTEQLQTHHESYEPEITKVLCVGCHQEKHPDHGVGLPVGWKHGFIKDMDSFSEKWDLGYTYNELCRDFNISSITVRNWANLLEKGKKIIMYPPILHNGIIVECHDCNSEFSVKHGKKRTRNGLYQRYKCNQCGHIFQGEKLE